MWGRVGLWLGLALCCSMAQAQIVDYGRNKQQSWFKQWQRLSSKNATKNVYKFRVLQLGDSHTAADVMTATVRTKLQQRYGDGGIGWIFPMRISGQRDDQVAYEGAQTWQWRSSRRHQDDFLFGGVLAQTQIGSTLSISDKKERHHDRWTVRIWAKKQDGLDNLRLLQAPHKVHWLLPDQTPLNRWGLYTLRHQQLPLQMEAVNHLPWTGVSSLNTLPQSANALVLGPMLLENQRSGVVYSNLGLNGARLQDTQKWSAQWLSALRQTPPNLLVLAYGTNEAADKNADIGRMQQQWSQLLQRIRRELPKTGILIIGAPEALASTTGRCGRRLPMLNQVQQMQRQLARQYGTLYWSWEKAMGGKCSMKKQIRRKDASSDGIHFSNSGYEKMGNRLARDLLQWAQKR